MTTETDTGREIRERAITEFLEAVGVLKDCQIRCTQWPSDRDLDGASAMLRMVLGDSYAEISHKVPIGTLRSVFRILHEAHDGGTRPQDEQLERDLYWFACSYLIDQQHVSLKAVAEGLVLLTQAATHGNGKTEAAS